MRGSVAPIVAVVAAALVGGIGIAQASSPPSGDLAEAAGGKKRHKLDVDYKTGFIDVVDEPSQTTAVFANEAKLAGRPFGSMKVELDEERFATFPPPQNPQTDFSGTEQVSFKAVVLAKQRNGVTVIGKFRGFYNYSHDSNGTLVYPISGVFTGGSGKFRGAGGRFDVLDLHNTSNDPVREAGRWQGFIRY